MYIHDRVYVYGTSALKTTLSVISDITICRLVLGRKTTDRGTPALNMTLSLSNLLCPAFPWGRTFQEVEREEGQVDKSGVLHLGSAQDPGVGSLRCRSPRGVVRVSTNKWPMGFIWT